MHFADELVLEVSALAIALSKELTDNEMEILATLFTQLGDTLATLAVAKGICESKNSERK